MCAGTERLHCAPRCDRYGAPENRSAWYDGRYRSAQIIPRRERYRPYNSGTRSIRCHAYAQGTEWRRRLRNLGLGRLCGRRAVHDSVVAVSRAVS